MTTKLFPLQAQMFLNHYSRKRVAKQLLRYLFLLLMESYTGFIFLKKANEKNNSILFNLTYHLKTSRTLALFLITKMLKYSIVSFVFS